MVVKQRVRPHLVDKGLAIGLDIPFLVRRAADDLRRVAVPNPVHLKTGLGPGSAGRFNCASFQVFASSVLISTFAILPRPLQAKPVIRL